MKWFRSIKTKLARRDDAPRLSLAVFGKHRAFADHIESGIGTMTPAVSAFKQRLYNGGIKPLIDSGVWSDKPEDRLLAGFDHRFVTLSDADMLIGRLWTSSDSRGRSEYPFVCVVQVQGAPIAWAVRTVDEELDRLRERAAAANSDEDLRVACGESQRRLDEATTAIAETQPVAYAPRLSEVIEHFFSSRAFGPDAIGFRRALHMIDDASGPRSRGVPAATLQMRMPKTADDLTTQLVNWSILLLETLPCEVPVVAVAPIDQNWVDLMAGTPGPEEFYILRATDTDVSRDSDTPYEIAPDIEVRWRQRTSSVPPGGSE